MQLAWLKVTAMEEITVKLYYKNKLLSWILSNKDIINMTAYMILIYWYWFASKLSHKVLVLVVQEHVQNKAWWTLPKDLDICHWIQTWGFSMPVFLVCDTVVYLLFLFTDVFIYLFLIFGCLASLNSLFFSHAQFLKLLSWRFSSDTVEQIQLQNLLKAVHACSVK